MVPRPKAAEPRLFATNFPDEGVLAPGSYTAQVTGAGGSAGVALVEVYQAPWRQRPAIPSIFRPTGLRRSPARRNSAADTRRGRRRWWVDLAAI